LIDLNLLRYVNNSDYNFIARKLTANIGIDFAKKIADEFDLNLNDFVNLEKF
jgi:hypothetical protein